jgi:AhpD family alkylhydroperoxidase
VLISGRVAGIATGKLRISHVTRRYERQKFWKERSAMKPRLDIQTASPSAAKAMMALEAAVQRTGLEKQLLELVKMRSSQINGCAYCLDMHSKDARARGETEQRLYGLNAWRETPYYTDRERAALEWTESLTLVSETHVPDEAFEIVKAQFSEEEIANLTLAIVAINGWNRICISARVVPGEYVSPYGKKGE